MTWCRLCNAEGFVKKLLGNTVILDCGHIWRGDTGPRDDGAPEHGPRCSCLRCKPPVPVTRVPPHAADASPVKRDPVSGRVVKPEAPPAPPTSFNPNGVAKRVSDILRRKK